MTKPDPTPDDDEPMTVEDIVDAVECDAMPPELAMVHLLAEIASALQVVACDVADLLEMARGEENETKVH